MRNTFSEALYEEATRNPDVYIVVADISPAGSMSKFSPVGQPLSSSGFTGGGMEGPQGIAIDASGRAYRFDGSGWTGPTAIGDVQAGPGRPSVSCTGPRTCLAGPAGGDPAWTWDGPRWSGPATLPAAGIEALGCAPSGYCAAVDALGDAFALEGGDWVGTAGDWGSVSSISCVAASFCMSASGGVSQWTGQSWTVPATLGVGSPFVGVSCPAKSFCMAVSTDGEVVQWDGTAWSEPTPVSAGGAGGLAGVQLEGVSCPTAAFCVAVDSRGRALVWRAGTWTADDVDGARPLSAVSCPTATSCVLVDRDGYAVVATAARMVRPARSR